jgi:hypothetical protein
MAAPCIAAPNYRNIDNAFLGHAYMVYQQGDQLQSMAMLMAAGKQNRLGDNNELGQLFLANNFTKLGLYEEAIKVYTRLANRSKTSQGTMDTAWLESAKLHLEQGQSAAALAALAKIKSKLYSEQKYEFDATKSRALLEQDKVDEAISALPKITDNSIWTLYQTFNIGVKLLTEHRNKNGAVILHQIGRLENDNNSEIQAIQDQANLALGFSLLKINKPQKARSYLENVRLKSHLSDLALLGMGWSYSSEGNYEQALVFWLELQNRPNGSAYNYETMLAVPFALGKAEAYNQAIQHYQAAQQRIDADIQDMDEAKQKINSDLFPNLISAAPDEEASWLVNWMNSPESPENRFLPLLLDNPEFQTALKEYRTLLQLSGHLQPLEAEIKQLEEMFKSTPTDNDIAKLHMRFQTVSQRNQQGLELQLGILKQQAIKTLSRYQAQLKDYSKQIKFGIAQAIEGGTFDAEEGL